jgi:hypothetical protein
VPLRADELDRGDKGPEAIHPVRQWRTLRRRQTTARRDPSVKVAHSATGV